jgi:hypothetical protein
MSGLAELFLVGLLAVESLTLLGIGAVMAVNAIFETAGSRALAFGIIVGAIAVFALTWLFPETVVIALAAISILTLLGMGAMMAIGAVFSNRPLVTSLPAEQERLFAPFERRASASTSLSWLVGLASAGVFMAVALVIYIKVPPEQKDMTKGMNMSNLTKKKEPAPKPPTTAPAEAPSAPAEAAPGSAAPEAPKP